MSDPKTTFEVRFLWVDTEWGEPHWSITSYSYRVDAIARARRINESLDAVNASKPKAMLHSEWLTTIRPHELFLRDLLRVGGDIQVRATVHEVSHWERKISLDN